MTTNCRVAAIAALSVSLSSLAGANPNAPAPAAEAPKAVMKEYPLSCNAAAKPLVLKAWNVMFTGHDDDARAMLKQAVADDPKCVMAKATLATITPGAQGKVMFDEALGMTAGLSEVEKLDLQSREAMLKGDPERALQLARKTRDLIPDVAIASIVVSMAAQEVQQWDAALTAAQRAVDLEPSNATAWNILGYANIGAHKYAEAVSAFKRYAEISPADANAHDSLADALLANGQLDEAAAHFQKAIDVSAGRFYLSYTGIAAVKGIKGDWDGARAAVAKARDAATEPAMKVKYERWAAWAWLAQGNTPAALRAIDASTKVAAAAKLDGEVAWGSVLRGRFALHTGNYPEALRQFAAAEKVKLDALPDMQRNHIDGHRLAGVIEAQARGGKVVDAEKTLPQLERIFASVPGDTGGADLLARSRGLIALAKKDPKGAIESFSMCTERADACRLDLAEAQEKSGDRAAANDTRTALLKANHRDPSYWAVRVRAEKAMKKGGTGTGTR